jgi:hypothetical protein
MGSSEKKLDRVIIVYTHIFGPYTRAVEVASQRLLRTNREMP